MTGPEGDGWAYPMLRRAFDRLPPPESTGGGLAWSTEPVLGHLLLGRSQAGRPAVLVPAPRGPAPAADRHFANLRVRHGLILRPTGAAAAATFSVLECTTSDAAIQDWFLRMLPVFRERLGPDGHPSALNELVAWLGELFRRLDAGSRRSLPALWAELLLVGRCTDPGLVARSWHATAASTRDFSHDGWHVEVKSAAPPERRHYFSPQQLHPADRVLVASVLLEPADSGTGLLELYDRIVHRLQGVPELQDKVHGLVMAAVGRALAEAEETRFDERDALETLRFYRAADVPQLHPPFPAEVADVRFSSALASASPLGLAALRQPELWASIGAAGGET